MKQKCFSTGDLYGGGSFMKLFKIILFQHGTASEIK